VVSVVVATTSICCELYCCRAQTAKTCWSMKVEACYNCRRKNELQVSGFYFYLALCFVICFDFKGLGLHTIVTNDVGIATIVLFHFNFKALRW
jgi:hypothetical protein